MLKKESTLRPGLFRLPDEPVAENVLIPGFRAAKSVRGAFGWFTAGWIGRLAPGLAVFLNREGTKPIKFTVAPALFPHERAAIERGLGMTAQAASQLVVDVFVKGRADASALASHALDCLSWMIANERLQLRIAVPTSESNYHPKIWLFDDGEDQVLARGSGNATARGVAAGVEHLDVDVSWISDSQARVKSGTAMLDDWSQGKSLGIDEVVELPEALAREIIRTAPGQPPQPRDYEKISPPSAVNGPMATRPQRLSIPADLEWRRGRYAHQGEAVQSWEEATAPETGVIAMATGAGKTLTALISATRSQDRLNGQPFLVVVSAPSIPLIMQWREEVKRFGVSPVVPSLEKNITRSLTRLFRALRGGGTHVVIVTNKLLCRSSFHSTVKEKIRTREEPIATMLIADEAHTLGAESFIRNKPEFFKKRLALSATPERQFDPDGTEEIFKFFGPTVYEFGLNRAIGFCLVPYSYYVHASTLGDDELEKFERLSQQIGTAFAAGANEGDDARLRALLIARRRIIETGRSKIDLLRKVLIRRGPKDLEHTLVYVSAKNPEQFDKIGELLTTLAIKWAPVTQDTTRTPEVLQRILDSFTKGSHQVLLAKKVLDEGVDIPSVREAFIVASSTVEREWVQRRGRVLRLHPGKSGAIVHDFLALPPVSFVRRDGTKSLRKIIQTELHRAFTFGQHAQNVAGKDGVHADLKRLSTAYWPEKGVESSILNSTNETVIASAIPRGRA